jgi:hypothetical protein
MIEPPFYVNKSNYFKWIIVTINKHTANIYGIFINPVSR